MFMDCWVPDSNFAPCSVAYVLDAVRRVPVSAAFDSSQRSILDALLPEHVGNFLPLEDQAEWKRGLMPKGTAAVNVAPRGGTLVLFDSVTCPHEVLAVGALPSGGVGGTGDQGGGDNAHAESRIALAGWFHEAQQPFPSWLSI